MRKAIIGGTGICSLWPNQEMKEMTVETKFGDVPINLFSSEKGEIVFLPRHGADNSIPPHLINYRANIAALKKMEVDEIYATFAVGSMNPRYAVGEVVVIEDFIDLTKNRIQSFCDGEDGKIRHVQMAEPFCKRLTQNFITASFSHGITVRGRALYICTEGPRYETAAEVKMYRHLGGDVAGMTCVPECVLARELGMHYAAVGLVTNWCTGFGDGKAFKEIVKTAEKNKEKVVTAFMDLFLNPPEDDGTIKCTCKESMLVQ